MSEGERHLVTRRSVLMSGALGLAAVYGIGCGGDDNATSGGGGGGGGSAKPTGTVTFGSNYSDPVPKKAIHATLEAFTQQSGVKVNLNEVDHNTFQEQINNYLQGQPDDVFTWFAGNRMQFFAERGLVGDISDVWEEIGDQFSDAFKAASARTASSTSCRSTTTRGRSGTARASSTSTAGSRRRRGTSSWPCSSRSRARA
jgi:multiple sugar transport system substrate-binding protein